MSFLASAASYWVFLLIIFLELFWVFFFFLVFLGLICWLFGKGSVFSRLVLVILQ